MENEVDWNVKRLLALYTVWVLKTSKLDFLLFSKQSVSHLKFLLNKTVESWFTNFSIPPNVEGGNLANCRIFILS